MRKRYIYIGLLVALLLTGCGANQHKAQNEKEANAKRLEGVTAYETGDYESAKSIMTEVIHLSGDNASEICLDAMYYCAASEMKLSQLDEAMNTLNQLIERADKKKLADAYLLRGECYIANNQENEAVADFNTSLEIKGDDYATYCTMYECFMQAGYTERAESYLKRLISDDQADSYLMGRTYYNLGKYAEAEDYLLKSYDEGNMQASYYLVMVYEEMGEYTKATDFYHSYFLSHTDDVLMLNQYGAFLIRRGEYQEALEQIEKGLALPDENGAAKALLYNEAICYEYLEDYAKARACMEAYVKEYPSDLAAKKEWEFLQSR